MTTFRVVPQSHGREQIADSSAEHRADTNPTPDLIPAHIPAPSTPLPDSSNHVSPKNMILFVLRLSIFSSLF